MSMTSEPISAEDIAKMRLYPSAQWDMRRIADALAAGEALAEAAQEFVTEETRGIFNCDPLEAALAAWRACVKS